MPNFTEAQVHKAIQDANAEQKALVDSVKSMPNNWREEFDQRFLCHKPDHAFMSDHQFAHDKAGRLPEAFKEWVQSKFSELIKDAAEITDNDMNVEQRLRDKWL